MKEKLFLIDDDNSDLGWLQAVRLRTEDELRAALASREAARFVAADERVLMEHALSRAVVTLERLTHRLMLLDAKSASAVGVLSGQFREIVVVDPETFLPLEEANAVLTAEHPEDYALGVCVFEKDRSLLLTRGDLSRLAVPFDWFEPSGDKTSPDFRDVEVIDWGQTLRLGKYEAAVDAILYEFDPRARRRMLENQIELDDSLGGSIRRLRLQKRVSRTDFPDLSEKTIARIERNESPKPHQSTLAKIACRLGTSVGELDSF